MKTPTRRRSGPHPPTGRPTFDAPPGSGRAPDASGLQRHSTPLNPSMRSYLHCCFLGVALLLAQSAAAASFAEIEQDMTEYNRATKRGVPLSSELGNPAGSDGRGPSGGGGNLATENQFQSVISFGGVVAPATPGSLDVSKSYAANHGNIGLPVGKIDGLPRIVLHRSLVGAPYVHRRVSLHFGSVIPPPSVRANGQPLPEGMSPEDYWRPEPFTDATHEQNGYYWSRHARKVFAIQAGPIDIIWRKAVPEVLAEDPEGFMQGETHDKSGNNYFQLRKVTQVATGSAVKPAKHMYWTEGVFRDHGYPVNLPQASVSAVKIVYNNNFPERVEEAYVAEGQSFILDHQTPEERDKLLQEKRTLWYDDAQRQIHAYNREGRVFVELLGDNQPDGASKVHLGFEIVDVFRQPNPHAVVVDLGDRLPAYQDRRDDSELFPIPILRVGGTSFTFQHPTPGREQSTFYAVAETGNLNDVLLHWLEPSVQGIRWPLRFVRYQQIWPTDVARYSHYVRPRVTTEMEAAETAVKLPSENVPALVYQDPLDRPRGALDTSKFTYYSFLDDAHAAHRALLRLTSGENIAFERIFSWLDTNLIQENLANTVATNLTVVAHHLHPELGFADGEWRLYVRDDEAQDTGSLASWTLIVHTMNHDGAPHVREFSGPGISFPDTIGNAAPWPSSLNVRGITEPVTSIEVRLNGLSHTYPADLDIILVGPNGEACVLLSDKGGDADITNLNLTYSDYSTNNLGIPLTSGTWRPSDSLPAESSPTGGPVVTTLAALLSDPPLFGHNASVAPRVVTANVPVGDRIEAPLDDTHTGSAGSYLAGHINTMMGDSYNALAYVDPLSGGFAAATNSAIIPVNVIPGKNQLEVWWSRPNGADTARGFKPIYWPEIVGRYTIEWPAEPREIVLASNDGSGTLGPREVLGSVYRQSVRGQAGYNPNEEHAKLSGDRVYATRDDLNIVTQDAGTFSSRPYVLLDYRASDGRPAMSVFKVLREKPEEGLVFDYIVPAGRMLQPPMPLPLLAKPVEGTGDRASSRNHSPRHEGEDLPGGWDEAQHADSVYGRYASFIWSDRNHDLWVYRGPHAGRPALAAGSYNAGTGAFDALPEATAVVNEPFSYHIHVSRRSDTLTLSSMGGTPLPAGLEFASDGLYLTGTPTTEAVNTINLVVTDSSDGSQVNLTLTLNVVAAGGVAVRQAPLTLPSTNPYTGTTVTFSDRPPALAASPTPANSFTMRYYYKTEAGFDWPGVEPAPPAGSIAPYLRPWDSMGGGYVGDKASKDTDSLEIVYRPVWPTRDPSDSSRPLPTLPWGATLTVPQFGLPGVKDFQTALTLYQQSIAANLTAAGAGAVAANTSVVLHDAVRQKFAGLKEVGDLDQLPSGVKTDLYQGRLYFPNLPPHLAERVWFDPNRGEKGSLVLVGKFIDAPTGEKYTQLNVLRGADLMAVKGLCPDADAHKQDWDNLVAGLATVVETFQENPSQPGSYIANPGQNATYLAGALAVITNANSAVESYALSAVGPGGGYVTLVENSGTALGPNAIPAGSPVAMHVFKVGGSLYSGELKVITSANPLSELVTFQHTGDLANRTDEYEYQWQIAAPVDGDSPPDTSYGQLTDTPYKADLPRYTQGGSGIRTLGDNYVRMRYRPTRTEHPLYVAKVGEMWPEEGWSEWTTPKLAEGWIKRVLAGINPFNQRVKDLYNNQVNTDVSILTQAGKRWEGDVALNLDTINNYGLIEIYETVLRRGRSLSIEAGINNGPANDALLLAAGYLNDLYMLLGGEAWADAENPTIGIGTADNTYGDIATALYAFKGQTASLLEEELALLRGRDDFLQPSVETAPFYNRLFWNYTRGIDSGEVIYALNYDIQENPNQAPDGIIDANDARRMFPQAHGDAYGHYLTALKGYYSLLMNEKFDWVPRIEAVNILDQPVAVDYQDERKFAAAAAAVARTGRQVLDLTWRRDFKKVETDGWEHLGASKVNDRRSYLDSEETEKNTERFWGVDHWATRAGQGAYFNWVVGNAILPADDTEHEGIQKVDRTTVPELLELISLADGVQTALENAEGGLSPLGVPRDGLAFDINPNTVIGAENGAHFDQIFERAVAALNNAVVAFDDAKDVTRLMRSEQDSLIELEAAIASQELAYTNALIELYGTPYPDDIGPGRTYKQGYAGPDTIHYMYVDLPETKFPGTFRSYTDGNEFSIEILDLPKDWQDEHRTSLVPSTNDTLTFNIGAHGFHDKPLSWTGRRSSPGRIQQAISERIAAHTKLRQVINDADGAKNDFLKAVEVFKADVRTTEDIRLVQTGLLTGEEVVEVAQFANDLFQTFQDSAEETTEYTLESVAEALPKNVVVGLASGGDLTAPARAAITGTAAVAKGALDVLAFARNAAVSSLTLAHSTADRWLNFGVIDVKEWDRERRAAVFELGNQLNDSQVLLWEINERFRALDDAERNYRALLAEGDRIRQEREIERKRASALIQGYRTRDAAFRIFRNEKLERYKTLFDLAARYALLAANAYDYETGLLDTPEGQAFVNRIVNSRALGVVQDGEPHFSGSNTGDPGLSGILAEMKADWEVLRGRLGFNNPDAYGTTVSLRSEAFRVRPDADHLANWRDLLQQSLKENILDDADVRRHCLQAGELGGPPEPGIILTFSTSITEGRNLFGHPLLPGDHRFSPSSFATKIFGVGVALEGYQGMDDPSANGAVGGSSPSDPGLAFLDPDALAATPYIYLVPVGVDIMRSPPLGDASRIRSWHVNDLAIPMPFNIGGSDFSEAAHWQSEDSLTEPLFAIRKHQAFRPVSDAGVFSTELYGDGGTLARSQYTNNRLVGRSVWNTSWKLVIPGRNLLADPDDGLERFIRTVKDIKLNFVTYSYSGN